MCGFVGYFMFGELERLDNGGLEAVTELHVNGLLLALHNTLSIHQLGKQDICKIC